MNIFHTILNGINKLLGWVSALLFGALVCTVTWQVFARKVLKNPSGITEELAKILFVWMVLMAAAYLFGERNGHMNVAIIQEKVSGRFGALLLLLSDVAIFGFSAFVLVYGGGKAVINGLMQTNAAIPMITTGQIYAALPICGIVTCIYCIRFFISDLMGLGGRHPAPKPDAEEEVQP